MKALAVYPQQKQFRVIDNHPEPRLDSPSQVRAQMLEVGICGTDKEIVTFEYGDPPEGFDYLVLGHESLAEIVETGSDVTDVVKGDLVVFSVRRPCHDPECIACLSGRQDFCYTGEYQERGIKSRHGFLAAAEDVGAFIWISLSGGPAVGWRAGLPVRFLETAQERRGNSEM